VKFLTNEKGIALVTSLMLTLLTLTISMVMLYMVLQSTRMSGAHKRYKNSLDAAVGGADIVTMDALPYLLGFAMDPTLSANLIVNLNTSMNLNAALGVGTSNDCLQAKLTSKVWGAACGTASSSIDAKSTPEFTIVPQSKVPGLDVPSGFTV